MSADNVLNSNGNINTNNQRLRRQSILSSSNPNSDVLPIDCILVYDRTESNRDNDDRSINGHQSKKKIKQSEHRRKFEEYLRKKQGLVLNCVVS